MFLCAFAVGLVLSDTLRKKRSIVGLLDVVEDYCESDADCKSMVIQDLIETVDGKPYISNDGSSRITELLNAIDKKCTGRDGCSEALFESLQKQVENTPRKRRQVQKDYGVEEQIFEKMENGEELDEESRILLKKDECINNKEACKQWVEKEEKLGLNHVGDIHLGLDGQPIAKIPKSLFFREELRLADGKDEPEE